MFKQTDPLFVLFCIRHTLTRLHQRFSKAFVEIVQKLTPEPHGLDFVQLHEMFRRWDVQCGFDKRPKSDLVMRLYIRTGNMMPPKCKWLGWTGEPLSDWHYAPPSTKEVLLMDAREQAAHGALGSSPEEAADILKKLEEMPDEVIEEKIKEIGL